MTTITTTTTTASSVQPLEGALRIPLTLIAASPLNPRKRWNTDKVSAMAADMAVNGQIQPIRVRPNPQHTTTNGRPPYEIVVGETRWRAASGAGLQHLDAVVRDCTDQELIQLALAENTKRQDLHPLEEADGYDALLRKPDGLQGFASVQDLAAAVGVSPSYVYQRLKLRNLCGAGREAFLAGTIDASVALLIARMPDPTEQARATARIITGFGGEPYSFRQASEFLKREFMLSLQLARFDVGATYKVAGPCSACNKRSGAAPDLFADVASAGDLCQDARCYAAKAEEAHQQLLQAARDAGRTVLQGAKARAVMPSPDADPVGHYRLDAPCPALTDSGRPLRALLGQGFAGNLVVIDLPGTAPVELVPRDVAERAIKARGLLRSQTTKSPPASRAPAPSPAGPVFQPKGAAQPTKPPAPAGQAPAQGGKGGNEAVALQAKRAVDEADVRVRFGALLLRDLADELRAVDELPLLVLRLVVRELWVDCSAEESQLLFATLGWSLDEAGMGVGYNELFDEKVQEAEGRALGELLALLLVLPDCADEHMPTEKVALQPAGQLARRFGIDLSSLMAHARREVAQDGDALDATTAFLAAHRPAGGAEEVSDKASAPTAAFDKEWRFPGYPD